MPDVRDQLGKLGGSLMALGASCALAYLITSRATGQPSPHLTWPVWPPYLCGALFAGGAYLYFGPREMLPWQRYHALKRRVEAAESALENARAELIEPYDNWFEIIEAGVAGGFTGAFVNDVY